MWRRGSGEMAVLVQTTPLSQSAIKREGKAWLHFNGTNAKECRLKTQFNQSSTPDQSAPTLNHEMS